MLKPRALRPGDRIAVVAPASPFSRDEFNAGLDELRVLGFDPTFEPSVFERHGYLAGSAETRAAAWLDAWRDPSVAALVAVRGGYGSVQMLPRLAAADVCGSTPKAFIGYSDNTSLLAWLTTNCGIVSFHGPMLEGRLARGEAGYDRDTLLRALSRPEPMGEIGHPQLVTVQDGDGAGVLVGGTLTQLLGSLGTPFAFDPPEGCILFIDEVGERPYRLDRMLTQLRFSGLLRRASGVVFGELPRCDEAGSSLARSDVVREALAGFPGPVLFGLPSGHTVGATLTLPFGVRAEGLRQSQAGRGDRRSRSRISRT